MKVLLTLLMSVAVLRGCVAKHKRNLNLGEKTHVSDDVRALVMAADDGLLDIRRHENVRCERIRIVGTHRVTRLCYTTEEDKEIARKTKEEYWKAFGFQKCLDRALCGGN